MTIVASVKVRDGLILATDSMSQVWGTTPQGPQFFKAYENARKLFQIEQLPVGVMTYGLGNIGNRSIEGVMLDFRQSIGQRTKVESLSQALYDYVKTLYDAQFGQVPADQQQVLGFYVAGYSPNQPFPEEWEFMLPRDKGPTEARPSNQFGAGWRGIDAPFTRLWKGFDPQLVERLKARGLSQQDVDADTGDLEAAAVYDAMPVQDAINFAGLHPKDDDRLLDILCRRSSLRRSVAARNYPP